MSNQASTSDIADFLAQAKNEILGLVVGDYYKGPKQDLAPKRPGNVWEFKKDVDGLKFYER